MDLEPHFGTCVPVNKRTQAGPFDQVVVIFSEMQFIAFSSVASIYVCLCVLLYVSVCVSESLYVYVSSCVCVCVCAYVRA